MVIQTKGKTEVFKLPSVSQENVFFADILGINRDENPIVGSWFRMENGAETTPPTYEYDEVGVMVEGEMTLRDETGHGVTVRAGEVFMFSRGSTITFSSDSYGLAWKVGNRRPAKL